MRFDDHGGISSLAARAALLATFALTGCGGGSTSPAGAPAAAAAGLPPAVAAAKAASASVDPAIVTADNAFGLDLLAQLMQGDATDNVTISPISVALTLQIAYNGAAGATQQAMANALQLGDLTTAQLNDANAALQASLAGADPAVTLTIANSLWMRLASNPVAPGFETMDQNYYGATIGDLAGAPANVNAWISAETQGLITKLLPPGNYADVVAVLANTVYFKAKWTTAFDPGQTTSASFTTATGGQVAVEMMQQSGSYPYLQGSNFQAVRLPYGDGRFSMLIVLPDPGTSLPAFVAGITPASLTGWVNQMQVIQGTIGLPRFTTSFGANLGPALTALGMGAAFCPYGNLSGIAPGACIGYVAHATVVEVDESGTTAAGATVVTVVDTIAMPSFTMTMDRPFLYAVRDDESGELLFLGVLVNPT